ncbi:MAG: hypothetical protein HY023_03440 [Chloroflexi bacterium]|nr:hypothetical protein [Chloroflexota bacterium]
MQIDDARPSLSNTSVVAVARCSGMAQRQRSPSCANWYMASFGIRRRALASTLHRNADGTRGNFSRANGSTSAKPRSRAGDIGIRASMRESSARTNRPLVATTYS